MTKSVDNSITQTCVVRVANLPCENTSVTRSLNIVHINHADQGGGEEEEREAALQLQRPHHDGHPAGMWGLPIM